MNIHTCFRLSPCEEFSQAQHPTCLVKLTKTRLPVMVFALSSKMYVCMHACRHLEAQKIKFRPGSPECFKTLTETKVWTHFLVQAGFWIFGLQLLKTYVFLFINQKTLTGRGILNIHTHLRVAALLSKTPLPVRVFDRLSYVCMYVRIQNPSQAEGF